MFLTQLVVLAASYSVSASVLNRRQQPGAAFQSFSGSIPGPCTNQCAGISAITAYGSSGNVSPLCADGVISSIPQCVACVQTNQPELYTSAVATDLQTLVDQIVTGCNGASSPISSVAIPTPTAPASATATDTGAPGSVTTAPTSSATTSRNATSTSTTTRRNGAAGRKADLASLGAAGALVGLGMLFFI